MIFVLDQATEFFLVASCVAHIGGWDILQPKKKTIAIKQKTLRCLAVHLTHPKESVRTVFRCGLYTCVLYLL